MATDKQLVEWFEDLYKNKAIYLWGANGEEITKKLTDKLFNWFGSKTYSQKYYDAKLIEGINKIGADCSGAFKPISGFDTTAQGYYGRCTEKGSIVKIPRDKACQVFHKNLSGRITHIGLYCGNGYTIEMKSSKDNCVKQKLNLLRWTYYGVPDWMEVVKDNPFIEPTETIYKGMKNPAVKWVQWELLDSGIKTVIVMVNGKPKKKTLTIDGDCGEITDAAIKLYQQKHGLEVDGKVGSATRKEMNK